MFERIPLESSFLDKYLSESNHIHFLGQDRDASIYIKVNNLEHYFNSKFRYWFELSQTKYAPIIIFEIDIENDKNEKSVYKFIYNIKEATDRDELSDIINQQEVMVNFCDIYQNQLSFGFSYILPLKDNVIEEIKRAILQAEEYSRKMVQNYSFEKALELFKIKDSIFKLKTQISSDVEIFLPQDEEEDNSNIENENNIEESEPEKQFFFKGDPNYKDEESFSYNNVENIENGEELVVKTYKREQYEKMKDKKVPSSKKIELLEEKISSLELTIDRKNREISRLKAENKLYREEIDYLKLDKPKKGWKWPFKKDEYE